MAAYGATLLRVILGITYLMHAYLGFVVFTPAGWVAFAQRNGVPLPEVLVWYVILAHGLGGAALILGLWARWAALVNVPVILGALLFVRLKQGFFMKAVVVDAAKGQAFSAGYEFELLLLVATIALVFLGGGPLAITRDK